MKPIQLGLFLSLAVLGILPACKNNDTATSPSPGPTHTPTTTPTATLVLPSATPTDTKTVTDTPTVTLSPTPTLTRTITNTPTVTNTKTITPTPTVTNTPLYNAGVSFGDYSTMYHPTAAQYAGGNLWVTVNNSLQEWTASGHLTQTITSFTGGSLSAPWGVHIDPATGNLYVGNRNDSIIDVFSSTGTFLASFGYSEYNGDKWAQAAVVNSSGTTVYALDLPGKVYVYSIGGTPTSPTYTYQASFGYTGTGKLGDSFNLCLDGSGNVLVADYDHSRVAIYGPDGTYQNSITSPDLYGPVALAVDAGDDIYVVDSGNDYVLKFDPSGNELGTFGAGILSIPEDLSFGSSGTIYVSNTGDSEIVAFH